MNKLLLGLIAIAISFTSCNTEEEVIDNSNDVSMLKSFVVSRNLDGSYAVSHKVTEGVGTAYSETKTDKEIYLFEDNTVNKSTSSSNYNVVNNELNINFIDENNSILPKVSILDDNTSNKADNLELLNTYSFSYNENGTLQLNFEVQDGVAVSFGNSDDINDIYLEEGSASQTNYSKNYTKNADGSLHIDFVQTVNKASKIKHPSIVIMD